MIVRACPGQSSAILQRIQHSELRTQGCSIEKCFHISIAVTQKQCCVMLVREEIVSECVVQKILLEICCHELDECSGVESHGIPSTGSKAKAVGQMRRPHRKTFSKMYLHVYKEGSTRLLFAIHSRNTHSRTLLEHHSILRFGLRYAPSFRT